MIRVRGLIRRVVAVAAVVGAALTPVSSPSVDGGPRVVFVGDSYTDPAWGTWAHLLATAKGWESTNLALGGTGYITPYLGGTCPVTAGVSRCPPFVELVGQAQAANPDVVVILGGRNELGQDPAVWAAGVAEFYLTLRLALPYAHIYGVAPLWDDDPPPAPLLAMRPVVEAAVTAVHGCFVDLHDPLLGHPELLQPDSLHPNLAGDVALRDAFLAHAPATCQPPEPEARVRPIPTDPQPLPTPDGGRPPRPQPSTPGL